MAAQSTEGSRPPKKRVSEHRWAYFTHPQDLFVKRQRLFLSIECAEDHAAIERSDCRHLDIVRTPRYLRRCQRVLICFVAVGALGYGESLRITGATNRHPPC